MSLTHRFFLIVSLPVLICLVALSVLLYSFSRQELENEYTKRMLAEAEEIQLHVENGVNLAKSDLATLTADRLLEHYFMYGYAGELDYQEDVRASLEENFLEASKAKPKYASFRVFTMGGDAIVNITEQRRAYKYPDPKNAEWFNIAKGLKPDEIYVSQVYSHPEHHQNSIYVCKLFYYLGKPQAVVAIHLHMQDYFGHIIDGKRQHESEEVFLLGERGEILVHCSEKEHDWGTSTPKIIREILTGGEKYYLVDDYLGEIAVRKIFFPSAVKYVTGVIVSPLSEIMALTDKLRSRLQRLVIITSIIFLGLLYFTVRTIVRPLYGFLPICASCRKIRDDREYWNQIENYISDHSEAVLSHSLCPECYKSFKIFSRVLR